MVSIGSYVAIFVGGAVAIGVAVLLIVMNNNRKK